MLSFLLSGGVGAHSCRLSSTSQGRSAEASWLSLCRASRLALLRASRASPLIMCTVGGRSYTSKERRDGPRVPTQRVTSPSSFNTRYLNTSLRNSATGDELLSLVEQHLASLDFIHVSTALATLAKLHPVEQWKHDARTHLLVVRAGELLGETGEQALANSAWACSKLGIAPVWLPQWVKLTTRKMETMTSQGLSNSMYALGGFGYRPGEARLRTFYAASLDMSAFEPQHFSNILYSLALLKEVPDALWLDAFWSASKKKMAELSPQILSNIIWAAATLALSPPADWLAHFCDVSKEKMKFFNPQDFSNTLGRLRSCATDPSMPGCAFSSTHR